MTQSRREKLVQMLAVDPDDAFLNYALSLEEVKEGDRTAGIARLRAMNMKMPEYVPAYFRLGQIYAEGGETQEALTTLMAGIKAATKAGDDHAAAEMRELLSSLSIS